MVQNPDLPAEVALFVRGGKGDGKSVLGRVMRSWFGEVHSRHLTNPDQITGKHNAHMQQVIFLFADEAVVPQDKRAENVLKGMITEPTFTVEPKFVNAFEVPNYYLQHWNLL